MGVSNPQGVVFFGAVFPQFIDRSAGHVPLQLLALGAILLVLSLVAHCIWAPVRPGRGSLDRPAASKRLAVPVASP